MVCVGIDVAKDKHDCCILDSEGTTLVDCFTIPNNMDGFKSLLQTIQDCSQKSDKGHAVGLWIKNSKNTSASLRKPPCQYFWGK